MRLRKIEFIARVRARAKARYGVSVDEGWLADRVKDGLMHRFDREQNDGLSPSYYATMRHYRRALQIVRLESKNIRSRDSQLILLYAHGYGVSAAIANSSLEKILAKVLSRTNAKLRSNYFEKNRIIGPKAEKIISPQLGEIDERLKHLELPMSTYIEIAREWRLPRVGEDNNLFTGLIAPGLPVLAKVRSSSPQELDFARLAFTTANQFVFRPLVGSAISASPEFTALLLGMFLTFHEEPLSIDQLTDMVRDSDPFLALVADLSRLASSSDE